MTRYLATILITIFICAEISAQILPGVSIKKITPNLIVEDVNASKNFYVDKLGFTAILTIPDTGKFDFAMVVSDSATIMFQSARSIQQGFPEFDIKPSLGTALLYIDVADINAVKLRCKNAGIPILREVAETFYGTTEFVIRDNAGHFIVFAMDLPKTE